MRRKTRRRPAYYNTITFSDGTELTCTPTRKPPKKRLKAERIQLDAGHVINDFSYTAKEFGQASDAVRVAKRSA